VLAAAKRHARHTEQNSLNSNANFVAQLHNGFAGATLISVNRATKSSVVETTCQENQKTSFRSAKVRKPAPLRSNTLQMEKNGHLVAVFAVICKKMLKISDK